MISLDRVQRLRSRFVRGITQAWLLAFSLLALPCAAEDVVRPTADELAIRDRFVQAKLLGVQRPAPGEIELEPLGDDSGIRFGTSGHSLRLNKNWDDQPLRIGQKRYTSGLYMHANARVRVRLPGPGDRFTATVGVDSSHDYLGAGSIICAVYVGDRRVYQSNTLRTNGRGIEEKGLIDVDLAGAKEFILEITDAGDGIAHDFAALCDARVALTNGNVLWLPGPLTGDFDPSLPFSFLYDGQPFNEILSKWTVAHDEQQLDGNRVRRTDSYTDPGTGLVVRCISVTYADFPTVEWTVYFTNNGTSDTPILSDVQGIDVKLARGAPGNFDLQYQRGSTATPDELEPFSEELRSGMKKRLSPADGRPSSEYLPYFNLDWGGAGTIFALGWPGQWAVTFERTDERSLGLVGGQELTRFRLRPGETVRTPLCVLQFWLGEKTRAQNIWRRWMLAHNVPRPNGIPLEPIWSASSAAQTAEMMLANEQNQIEFIDKYLEHGLKFDYWWMDYAWHYYQGNDIRYEVDRERFPNGLRGITDHARKHRIKSIAWFEPEVCTTAFRVAQEHSEWILGEGHGLVNLGIPEAREWVTDQVYRVITSEGLDVFRSDFNFAPLKVWRDADSEDRQGITENKYVTGYLAFWDELLRRKPDLLIDACSSGGRRNDLETMRRAVPLWRSDYNNLGYVVFNYEIAPRSELASALQNQTYGLARWLPYFGTGIRDTDLYRFRSAMCPAIMTSWDPRRPLNYDRLKKATSQWRKVAPFYLGDFYPLTDYSQSESVWAAFQFHREDRQAGLIQVFRRAASPTTSAAFSFEAMDPAATYRVLDLDDQKATTATGQELLSGKFSITINDRPGSRLFVYERVGANND